MQNHAWWMHPNDGYRFYALSIPKHSAIGIHHYGIHSCRWNANPHLTKRSQKKHIVNYNWHYRCHLLNKMRLRSSGRTSGHDEFQLHSVNKGWCAYRVDMRVWAKSITMHKDSVTMNIIPKLSMVFFSSLYWVFAQAFFCLFYEKQSPFSICHQRVILSISWQKLAVKRIKALHYLTSVEFLFTKYWIQA